jgi:hypothetical protein
VEVLTQQYWQTPAFARIREKKSHIIITLDKITIDFSLGRRYADDRAPATLDEIKNCYFYAPV